MSFITLLLPCVVVCYLLFCAHQVVGKHNYTICLTHSHNKDMKSCLLVRLFKIMQLPNNALLCFSPFPSQTQGVFSKTLQKSGLAKAEIVQFIHFKVKRKVEFLQNMILFDWNQTSISQRSTTSWLLLTHDAMTTEGPVESGLEQGVCVCVCVLEGGKRERQRERDYKWRVLCGSEEEWVYW